MERMGWRRSNASRASTPMSEMSVTTNPMAMAGGATVHDNPMAMGLYSPPPPPAPPAPGEALRPQRSRARAAMEAAVRARWVDAKSSLGGR
jgi:hypothetical protein